MRSTRTGAGLPTESAGWADQERCRRWQELAYERPLVLVAAEREHDALRELLAKSGAMVVELEAHPHLSLDAVYTHDASLVCDHGAILLNMGKPTRCDEPEAHRRCYGALGIPILGSVEPRAGSKGETSCGSTRRLCWSGSVFACNVLSLGRGRLVALAECPLTNERLRVAGFEVLTFSGAELAGNGGGGLTYLTRPLLRSSRL